MPATEEQPIHLLMGEENVDEILPAESRAAITSLRVFARVRPFIDEELKTIGGQPLQSTIEMKDNSTFVLNPAANYKPTHEFEFDRSLWSIPQTQKLKPTPHFYENKHESHVDQQEMFMIATRDEQGISMIDNAFMGIHSCIMTYGQTSSGKTFTMMGKYGEGCDPKDRGIIPRVCDELFQKVQERREFEAKKEDASKRWEIEVSVTFVEIYLEKVRDLLSTKLRGQQAVRALEGPGKPREAGDMKEALAAMKEAKVRRDPVKGPFVEGIEHVPVNSWKDCQKVLERGSAHRTTAATSVHDNSSRSHAIFTVTLAQKRVKGETRAGKEYETRSAHINLVDLAGSERGGGTTYVNESSAINSSLLALRRVIDTLAEKQEKYFERQRAILEGKPVPSAGNIHVPYKDSVLTQLLEDSLGGNAKTVMISNMTPYHIYYEETLRTLQWAHKASKLVTVVTTEIDEADYVRRGYAGQMGALGDKLNQKKINLEGLQGELEKRKKKIQQLTEQHEKQLQNIDQLNQQYNNLKREYAFRVSQLALYLNAFRKIRERRRKQVSEAEASAVAARKDLREKEEKYEALLDGLLRHNITMARIKKKAEEINQSSDKIINDNEGGKQRQPEDLRKELSQKKADIQAKNDRISSLQAEQQATETLLDKYIKDSEENEAKRENERLEQEEHTTSTKAELLQDIMSLSDGSNPNGKFALAGETVPLFEMSADGKLQASTQLESLLQSIDSKKKDTQKQNADFAADKKAKESKKDSLIQDVKKKESEASGLESQIKNLNKQIEEEKKKCCKG